MHIATTAALVVWQAVFCFALDVQNMDKKQLESVLRFSNEFHAETLSRIECVSEQSRSQCAIDDIISPWYPQKRHAKVHVLLDVLTTRGISLETILESPQYGQNHPTSVLSRTCTQQGWEFHYVPDARYMELLVVRATDMSDVIPRQRKQIGESTALTRYKLASQALQQIALLYPPLQQNVLPGLVDQTTSYQSGEQLGPESDACEYKHAINVKYVKSHPFSHLLSCFTPR